MPNTKPAGELNPLGSLSGQHLTAINDIPIGPALIEAASPAICQFTGNTEIQLAIWMGPRMVTVTVYPEDTLTLTA